MKSIINVCRRLAPMLAYIVVIAACLMYVKDMQLNMVQGMACALAVYYIGKVVSDLVGMLLGMTPDGIRAELLDQAISNRAILWAILFHLEGIASKEVCDDIRDRIKATDAVIAKAGGAS